MQWQGIDGRGDRGAPLHPIDLQGRDGVEAIEDRAQEDPREREGRQDVLEVSVVFKFLLRIDIPNYALFLFVGLTTWTFFLGGAQLASSSLVANAGLVTKVKFPREIVPLASMTGNAFTAGAMLAIALPLCLILTEVSRLPLIVLPVLVVLLACSPWASASCSRRSASTSASMRRPSPPA